MNPSLASALDGCRRQAVATLIVGMLAVSYCVGVARAADAPGGPEIAQDLRAFAQTGRVLHIAAHPDDENTQLITYLARGRAMAAGYLSLNRRDGRQHLLGRES